MIISSFSVKYRDLSRGINIITQFLMYTSPVIYSTSQIPEKIRFVFYINPLTGFVENFRYAFTGAGNMNISAFIYSVVFTGLAAMIAVIAYERTAKDFIDIV